MSLPTQYQWYLDTDEVGTGDGGIGGGGVPGLPKIEVRIRVPVGGWSLDLTDADGTAVTVTVPAGDYYLNSVAPGGTVTFLTAVATALTNGGGVTYTVVADDDADSSTGKITITVSSGTFTLAWTNVILRDQLGFTGSSTVSSGTVAIGAKAARHLWLPNLQRLPEEPDPNTGESSDLFGTDAENFGREEADYDVTCSPSGVTTQTVGSRRFLAVLRFEPLLGMKMWTANEQVGNESYQTLWRDIMDNGGCPVRYHNWRADDDQYWTMVLEGPAGELHPIILVPGWVGPLSHWRLEIPARRYIPVLVNGVYE